MGQSHSSFFRKEKLWWIINQLIQDPTDNARFSHTVLLGLLNEYFATTSASKRGALDQVLYERVSDYIAYFQLLSTVRMHRPGFRSRCALDLKDTQDRYMWRTSQISTPEDLRNKKRLHMDLDATLQALQDFRSTAAPAGPRNEK